MSSIKEPQIFYGNQYEKKVANLNTYYPHFNNENYIGEASPIYSETKQFTEIPKRLFDYNSEAKIIYIVREPFARLESTFIQAYSTGHWINEKKYERYKKKMSKKFKEAIFLYPPLLESTKYWTHIQSYRKYFSDQNIKIVLLENLLEDKEVEISKLFKFLNINHNYTINFANLNMNSSKEKKPYNSLLYYIKKLFPDYLIKIFNQSILMKIKSLFKILNFSSFPSTKLSKKDKMMIKNILYSDIVQLYDYLSIKNDPWNFFNKK